MATRQNNGLGPDERFSRREYFLACAIALLTVIDRVIQRLQLVHNKCISSERNTKNELRLQSNTFRVCNKTVTKHLKTAQKNACLRGNTRRPSPGKAAPPGIGRMQMGNFPMFPMPTGPLHPIRDNSEPSAARGAATLTDKVASRLWRRDISNVSNHTYCCTGIYLISIVYW